MPSFKGENMTTGLFSYAPSLSGFISPNKLTLMMIAVAATLQKTTVMASDWCFETWYNASAIVTSSHDNTIACITDPIMKNISAIVQATCSTVFQTGNDDCARFFTMQRDYGVAKLAYGQTDSVCTWFVHDFEGPGPLHGGFDDCVQGVLANNVPAIWKDNSSASSDSLTPLQIGMISGGVIIAIAALALCCCISDKRRKHATQERAHDEESESLLHP